MSPMVNVVVAVVVVVVKVVLVLAATLVDMALVSTCRLATTSGRVLVGGLKFDCNVEESGDDKGVGGAADVCAGTDIGIDDSESGTGSGQ